MPQYIGYSPWTDAAQVGKGIGDALSTILFKLPMLKAEEARKDRELDLQERHYQAQEATYGPRSELYRAQAAQLPLIAALRQSTLDERESFHQGQLEVSKGKAEDQKAYNASRIAEMEKGREQTDKYQGGLLENAGRRLDIQDENAKTFRARYNLEAMDFGKKAPIFENPPGMKGQPKEDEVGEGGGKTNQPGWFNRTFDPPGFPKRLGGSVDSILQYFRTPPPSQPAERDRPFSITPPDDGQPNTNGLIAPEIMGQLQQPVEFPQEQGPPSEFHSSPSRSKLMPSSPPAYGVNGSPPSRGSMMENEPIQNGRDVPPNATHTIMIQNPTTGAVYWTTPEGQKRRPDWKVIQKF